MSLHLSLSWFWNMPRSPCFTCQWPYCSYLLVELSFLWLSLGEGAFLAGQRKSTIVFSPSKSFKASMISSKLSGLFNNYLIWNEVGIMSLGEAKSWPGCLDRNSDIVMSLPLRIFTLKEYWLKTSISILSPKVWGSLFAVRIYSSAEWSMITVNSVFLYMCLKLCILTASPHNSSSLRL